MPIFRTVLGVPMLLWPIAVNQVVEVYFIYIPQATANFETLPETYVHCTGTPWAAVVHNRVPHRL